MKVGELADAIGTIPPGQSGSPIPLWTTGYDHRYQVPWFVSRPWRVSASYRISNLLKLMSKYAGEPFGQSVQDRIQEDMIKCGIKENKKEKYSEKNGGVRTYKVLVEDHGLVYHDSKEKTIEFTPKGIEIMEEKDILCIPPMFFEQLLRHQFPNPCSLRPGSVVIHPGVRVRMYRFMMSIMAILYRRGVASISREQTAICACLGSGWQFLELCAAACEQCHQGRPATDILRSLGIVIYEKEWAKVLESANTAECRLLSTGACRRTREGMERRLALSDQFEGSMEDVIMFYVPEWFEVENFAIEDLKDRKKVREFQFRHRRGFLRSKSNLRTIEPIAMAMPVDANGVREIILHEITRRIMPNMEVPAWHPDAVKVQRELETVFPSEMVKEVAQETLSCNAIEKAVQNEIKSYLDQKGDLCLARKAEERASSLMRHCGFVAEHFGTRKSRDGRGWDYPDVFAFLRNSKKYVMIDSKIGNRRFCLSEKDKVVVGGYIERAKECLEMIRISASILTGHFLFVCSKIDYSQNFTRRMAEISSKYGVPVSAITWRDFWIMCDALSGIRPEDAESKLLEYLGKSSILSIGNMDGLYNLLRDRHVRMIERDMPIFSMLYGTGAQ